MKVNITLNSKELNALVCGSKEDIEYNWEIDVYTESGSVSKKGELAVFAGVYWALMNMLPWRIVAKFAQRWNEIINDFHSKVRKEAENLKNKKD